jgi:hypothetical protein
MGRVKPRGPASQAQVEGCNRTLAQSEFR